MSEKFNVYDLLATVVPGTLIVCLLALAVPDASEHVTKLKLPDAFAVIALVALAVFIGNIIQAVASFIDPFLYFTWTGKWGKYPSELCLESGLGHRYMPAETAMRIRGKLAAEIGEKSSDRSIFLYAMQQAEGSSNQRVSTFNGLFAYHRALLILSVIGVVVATSIAFRLGAPNWSWERKLGLLVGSILLLLLLWHRTKQRAFYYVREVLLTAERVLDQKSNAESH